jgi:hypothetical protein
MKKKFKNEKSVTNVLIKTSENYRNQKNITNISSNISLGILNFIYYFP